PELAVPRAPRQLDQAWIGLHRLDAQRLGDDLGRAPRAPERAGDDPPVRLARGQPSQQPPDGRRLTQSKVREVRINVALQAAFTVERGFAVTDEVKDGAL